MDQEKRETQLEARDDQGRQIYDEKGEKIHWASRRERIVALLLAVVVIAITIAMAYSIAVGDFFRH